MLELFLPWFLTTCISGILGNRADSKLVSIAQNISEQVHVGKIVNNDMQKALNRSFILSLLSICDSCLNELKHEYPLQRGNFKLSGQLRWLETKKLSLEDELKAVEKAEYGEPTIELLDEIKFILIQGDPTSEAFQKIKTELIERAEIGNGKAPDCYNKSVERNILSQMCNHFACEIERNQALSNILETQLLIQLGIKIDLVLTSVPSMIQNLNYIPTMAYQVDTMARQVDIMAQAMPQMLESISSEKNSNAPCRIFQVPPLTEEFVETPKKEEIKNYLLNSNKSRRILSITAIQGLGGIGKTTLATVLGHDEDVQNYFSDGILWAPLGQEPDKLSLLNNWIQALGDYQTIHTTTETASIHLRSLLCKKRILLVIDDAWDSSDVKPFLVGGSNCQTIITTRKAYIADDLSAESYPLNVMTKEQALELFRNALKDCWDENEKENALKVAKGVGYLPLALNLAAKRIRGGYSWTKLHEALEEEIARLGVLESPRIFGKGEEGLEASLNLSLKALRSCNENVWKNFIWLGVLPEDVKINKKMVSTLWDIDTVEAGEILEGLWGEGLLIRSSTINLEDEKLETYRMHDLLHDIALYCLTSSPDTKKATSLPGLGVKLKEAHTFLLNRYQLQTQKKELWHTLKDDAYIHSHLTWHLEKAGKIEYIHLLLREENENGKNGWYETLESLELNAVFIEDVIRAWNLSEKESIHQIEQVGKASSIGQETRYALIYTSINSLSANIPVELLVEFLETKKWTEVQVFTYAQKEPDPYKRATKLISIYQRITGEYIKKEEVIEKALDAASKIKDNYERACLLSAIVPYLEDQKKEEMIEKALDAISMIEVNDYCIFMALSAIVPYLDGKRKEGMIEKALDLASNIQSNDERARALSAIVPYLDSPKKERVIEKALDAAYKIQNDKHRIVRALSAIVPYLEGQKKEEVIEKAFDAIFMIKYNGCFITGALSTIVPYLDDQKKEKVIEEALYEASNVVVALLAIVPYLGGQKKEEVIDKTLNAAYMIEDNNVRAEALLTIIPYLKGQKKEETMEKTLDLAFKIKDNNKRAFLLSGISPYLDGQKKEEVMEKALDVASKIKDNYTKVRTLSAIVPYLDGQKKEDVTGKALDAAYRIEDNESEITDALSTVVPYLDEQKKEEAIEKALGAVFKINDHNKRVKSLSTIIPHLCCQKKEEVIEKAFDIASDIQPNNERVRSLLAIFPNLDEQKKVEVLEKALDAASRIENDYEKAEVLSIIISYLDEQKKEELKQKALDIVFRIKDNGERALVLSTIVPYLDEQKKEETIEKILDTTSKIKGNHYTKGESLSKIIPYLNGQKKEEVIEKALGATYMIEDNDGDFSKVLALSAIIPYLDSPKKEEVIEKCLDSISKIIGDGYEYESVAALSAIVPYFVDQEKVIVRALDVVSKIEYDDVRAEALSTIVPYLDEQKKEETIEKILDATLKIKDNNYAKAEALSAIVPYLERQKKEEIIEKILDAAYKIENDHVRANTLLTIVPYLDDQKKEDFIEKILNVASKIKSGIGISKILLSIDPKLDGQKKEELIEKAFDVILKIENDNKRADAFNIMLPHLRNLPMDNLYFWWRKAIQILRERTRSNLLLDIIVLIPVISELGEDDILFEISQAILDVSRWWP
ncbi:NB-ARC domain-containing protein [Methanosarcina hadiensis]|uniref:NB-ARC domain-containing protein n=1 Tax=Methanosarcina hadiensis TaxID=3078083 RepID=UPI00397768B5